MLNCAFLYNLQKLSMLNLLINLLLLLWGKVLYYYYYHYYYYYEVVFSCRFFTEIASDVDIPDTGNHSLSFINDANVLALHRLLWNNQEKIGDYLSSSRLVTPRNEKNCVRYPIWPYFSRPYPTFFFDEIRYWKVFFNSMS